MMRFANRSDAGKKLAEKLHAYKNNSDVVVIGLVRGGVPVAYEVAKALSAPLDIVAPRKIAAPFNHELALGAVTQDGQLVWNEALLKSLHLTEKNMTDIIEKERLESARRLRVYRGERASFDVTDKIVILVDDGIATGATMRAAIKSVRAHGARTIIVASPVSALDALQHIEKEVDACVSLIIPKIFLGISAFYTEFSQVIDEEVISLLEQLS